MELKKKSPEELRKLKNKIKYKELIEKKIKATSKLDQLNRIDAEEKRIEELEEEIKKIELEMRFLEE
jgi:hypothetical protein